MKKISRSSWILESEFDKNLSGTSIGENIRILSSKPHNLGSPGDKENV